jgi:outer membrane protein TolC
MFQLRWSLPIPLRVALLVGMSAGAWAQPAAPAPAAAQPGALPEDLLPALKPILKHALERSPDAIQHGLRVEELEAHAYLSRAAMLPNLGGYGRYSTNTAATSSSTSSATSRSSGFYYDVGFNQPVYHWGALKAQADLDRISVKIAGREYAEAARLLAKQVRASYLDLIAKKAALRAQQRQLELAKRGLDQQEEVFKAGKITAGDITSARAQFAEAQLQLEQATASFGYLKRVFTRIAGLEALPDDAIPAEIPPPTPAADQGEGLLREFLGSSAAQTYRSQVFALTIQQSDLNYRIARTGLLPKVSFNAGRNVSNLTQADFGSVRQEAIVQNYYGLIVNWTLFDSLATSARKREALARKRENERALQTYVEATTDLAQNLRQQAEFAARGLVFAESRLAGARSTVAVAQENLGRGRAAPEEVARAEAALLNAEAVIAAVRGDYLNRWVEFVSLVGADPAMNNLPPRYVR